MKAAYKTFVFSRISDLAMFTAYILIGLMFHTTDLSALFFKVPFYIFHLLVIGPFGFNFLFVLSTLILIAGGIKAAQFYSHVWLPDAMEAPTPASALIHSSTLVIMGIFLIIRFSILFEFSPITNYIMVIWGGYTIAYGAVVASNQDDIKKLVAYSTISQMGYLVCGCGYGAYEEVLIYMIIHAINKAFLFIIVGYTVHFFNGNTDLRQISHIYLYASDICIFIFFTCLNLLGLPYLMGFYAKEFLVLDTITGG
jgi:NADH-quinone oxidoreductase subunit L